MLTTVQCLSCSEAFEYERKAGRPGRLRRYCDGCRSHDRGSYAIERSVRTARPCSRCGARIPASVDARRKWCDACRVRPAQPLFLTTDCAVCGAAFYPDRPTSRWCSIECEATVTGKTTFGDRCIVRYGACMDCGVVIVANNGKRRCPACHLALLLRRRSTLKRNRRSRKLDGAEDFTASEIAERDGWICHICGDPIPDRPFEGWANDLTIDHLIPIAKGGKHRRNNVKAAHFHCNSERQDSDLPATGEWWDTCGYVA